jgi:RNA polymerase subunit RPABC4/transcription elongation factor Spt4
MIIWGSKGKIRKLETGQFYCPNCREMRGYIRKRVSKYFTLYFVPLFETENKGEYIECQACGNSYKPEVLEIEPPTEIEQYIDQLHKELEQGTSVGQLIKRFLDNGIDPQNASVVVFGTLGDFLRCCENCKEVYSQNIIICPTCHSKLIPITKREYLDAVQNDLEKTAKQLKDEQSK